MRNLKIEHFGEVVQGVTLRGDPKNPEPETFRVSLPWGDLDVTRATDSADGGGAAPDYWVHVRVNRPQEDLDELPGRLKAARLDQTDKSAAEADLGDFGRPELYHLAVRIGALEPVATAEKRVVPGADGFYIEHPDGHRGGPFTSAEGARRVIRLSEAAEKAERLAKEVTRG